MTQYEAFYGRVVRGKQLGRTLGFPTANLEVEGAVPECGVYAVWVCIEAGDERMGMMNIGRHPTLPDGPAAIEVNLLDFSGDLYGKRLFVRPVARLREERRFESLDALKAQLAQDQETVRRLL